MTETSENEVSLSYLEPSPECRERMRMNPVDVKNGEIDSNNNDDNESHTYISAVVADWWLGIN